MDIKEEIKIEAEKIGISDIGFGRVDDGIGTMKNVVSVVVRLSESVLEEIDVAPTHTYFHHYRTVNAFIDRAVLQIGMILQKHGFGYIPIAASQSININGNSFEGRYSHKKAAVSCGLGSIGKNSLFLHNKYGPAVRLGTLFTDCDFHCEEVIEPPNLCSGCDACVRNCPAMAIKGVSWHKGVRREEMFDAKACSEYMKKNFQHIGRGAVCGICINRCMKNCIKNEPK